MRLLAAPDVNELLPGFLLGAGPSNRDCRRLRRAGVTRVVDLRAEASSQSAAWGADVTVVRVPVVDRAGLPAQQLGELASMVNRWLRDGEVVLTHCEGGMGRTAMVACAVLVQRGHPLADAYRLVRDCRPVVAPTDEQMQALLAYERSLGVAVLPLVPVPEAMSSIGAERR